MKKFVLSAILAFAFVVPFAVSVAAQDLTVAYQWQRLSEDEAHRNIPAGFDVEGAFPIGNGMFGVVGEVDWSRKKEDGATLTLLGAGGGVRWASMKNPKVTPFVEATVGVMHHKSSDSDGEETGNNFVFNIDGGVAVPINEKCSAVGQVGWRKLKEDEPISFIRVVAGIRIKLSK